MGWGSGSLSTLPLAVACLARVRREGAAALALLAGIFVSHWCGYFPLRPVPHVLARRPSCPAPPRAVRARRPVRRLPEAVALVALLGVIEAGPGWPQAPSSGPLDALCPCCAADLMNAACAGLGACHDGRLRAACPLNASRALSWGPCPSRSTSPTPIVIGGLEVVLPAVGVTDAPSCRWALPSLAWRLPSCSGASSEEGPLALLEQPLVAVVAVVDELLREAAVLDAGQDALHGLAGLGVDDLRAGVVLAVLGGVGDRVVHEVDAGLLRHGIIVERRFAHRLIVRHPVCLFKRLSKRRRHRLLASKPAPRRDMRFATFRRRHS